MLAHEEAAEHFARALEVQERFEPRRDRTSLRTAAAARGGTGSRRRAALGVGDLPGGGDDRRGPRRQRGPGPCRDRRLEALHPASWRDRRAADRAARAGARDDGRTAHRRAGGAADSACGALYYSPARGRMAELAEEATEIAGELGDPEARALAAAARRRAFWDPGHLRAATRGCDRAAHARPRGR